MINHLLEEVDTNRRTHTHTHSSKMSWHTAGIRCWKRSSKKILTTEITRGAEIKGQISGSRRMAGVSALTALAHTRTLSPKREGERGVKFMYIVDRLVKFLEL